MMQCLRVMVSSAPQALRFKLHTHDADTDWHSQRTLAIAHMHAETDKTLADHEHGITTDVGSQDGEDERGRIASVAAHYARWSLATMVLRLIMITDNVNPARHTHPSGLGTKVTNVDYRHDSCNQPSHTVSPEAPA